MTKLVQRLRVKPGMLDEYKRRHDEIWEEMLDLMRQCGISNYTIWSFDCDLFAYCEIDDINACETLLRESGVKRKWDAYMSDIITLDESDARLMFEFD